MSYTTNVPGADVLGRPVGHVVAVEDRLPIVTDWSGMADYVNAPPDYSTLYAQYKAYTMFLVRKFAHREVEDIAEDILIRFMERDSIGVFSRDWETRSKTGKSNFRSYFSRFVVTYARGMNRNNVRHAGRYLVIADQPMDVDSDETWLSVHAGIDVDPEFAFIELVASIQAEAPDVPEALITAITSLGQTAPVVKVSELAAQAGVSTSVAAKALDSVRAATRRVLSAT